MVKTSAKLLIVGAGPAGLAAAASAANPGEVILVDDNPAVGGQVWRADLERHKHPATKVFLDAMDRGSARVLNSVCIYDVAQQIAFAESADGLLKIEFEKLIIATGARELFLPFPGWTLPGVFGAGGLQALVKGGLKVAGKRVIVAGTGPLLIAVAEYLKRKGATVLAIAEQASSAKLNRFAAGLMRSPAKLMQAVALRSKLFGVPYLTDCWITAAHGTGRVACVELTRKGKSWTFDCDYLACGFHLIPSIELARLLGCQIENGFVVVNENQQTSVENVYCAGEPTGIAGVESAILEGMIAGVSAAGQIGMARKIFRKRDRARRFGTRMNTAFALRGELRAVVGNNTIVCRCEDVEYGRIQKFHNFREAKLQTRCGMGPCQGRVCGPATQFLFGWELPSVRPPIFPVKMEHL